MSNLDKKKNLIDRIITATKQAFIENGIDDVHDMLNLQHSGGKEILENFVSKGLAFGEECKYTLTEKNKKTLDIVISRPGMQDCKYKNVDSPAIAREFFEMILKYTKIASLDNARLNFEEYTKDKDEYSRITAYFNKKLYDGIKKSVNVSDLEK